MGTLWLLAIVWITNCENAFKLFRKIWSVISGFHAILWKTHCRGFYELVSKVWTYIIRFCVILEHVIKGAYCICIYLDKEQQSCEISKWITWRTISVFSHKICRTVVRALHYKPPGYGFASDSNLFVTCFPREFLSVKSNVPCVTSTEANNWNQLNPQKKSCSDIVFLYLLIWSSVFTRF